MNLSIRKYLISNNQFRVFVIDKNIISDYPIENNVICFSALSTMLLNQEERITFNFKNKSSESFTYIDSFSQGECFYRMKAENVADSDVMLFVIKSKLKNFGASYNSIMHFEKFDLLRNLSAFYKESEQMELDFIEQEDFILMIQPMPCFEEAEYDLIKAELNNNGIRELPDENLIETTEVNVLNQQRVN